MPVTDDPTRRFTTEPDTGRKAYFLQAIADEMLRDPQVQEIIETVRTGFEIEPPTNEVEFEQNRQIDREPIRRRVCELATDTDWKGDLDILNLLFRPDDCADAIINAIDENARTRRVYRPGASQLRAELIREDRAFKSFINTVREAYLATEFPAHLVDLAVDYIADRVIDGDFALPRPLPTWFAYGIFALPIAEVPLLFAVVGPFADIDQVTDDLRDEYHRRFVPGERERISPEAERNVWLLQQYHRLGDEESIAGETVIDRLLLVYEAGPYRHHLDRYDLDTAHGQKAAKDHIRDVLRKERDRGRQFLEHFGTNLEDPSGG